MSHARGPARVGHRRRRGSSGAPSRTQHEPQAKVAPGTSPQPHRGLSQPRIRHRPLAHLQRRARQAPGSSPCGPLQQAPRRPQYLCPPLRRSRRLRPAYLVRPILLAPRRHPTGITSTAPRASPKSITCHPLRPSSCPRRTSPAQRARPRSSSSWQGPRGSPQVAAAGPQHWLLAIPKAGSAACRSPVRIRQ